ncbi:MAG: hypothetical protein GIW94_02960 [Candidatus Eremiobacteraeota bacterium]|nr:hypothetical protein [Candidatus Eremiobacteraeota bacterium]MBC5821481.1 hypothetical protein [Candidatus Eremiobacteraeota bacterium]
MMFAVAGVEGLRNAIAFQFGNEGRPLGRVWHTALRILAVLAPVGSFAFLALWLHDRSQLAFLFVAIAFPFAAYLQTVNIVYLVRGAVERLNTQNASTVGAGSAVVIFIAVVGFHANIIVVLSIWAAGHVAAALWATVGLPGLLRAAENAPDATAATERLWPEQARFALKGGASAAVTLIALRIDIIIVGSMLAKNSLGIYTTALAVAELLTALSRSVTWATTGRISTAPRAAAVALTAKVIRLLLAGQALAATVVFLVGPAAIHVFYGPRFDGAGLLLRIVLARTVVYSVDGVVSYFISVRAGRPGTQFAFELGTLVLCAVSTSLAVGRFGLVGAAVAATATFLIAFAVKLSYFTHVAGVRPRDVLLPQLDDVPPAVRLRLARVRPVAR